MCELNLSYVLSYVLVAPVVHLQVAKATLEKQLEEDLQKASRCDTSLTFHICQSWLRSFVAQVQTELKNKDLTALEEVKLLKALEETGQSGSLALQLRT